MKAACVEPFIDMGCNELIMNTTYYAVPLFVSAKISAFGFQDSSFLGAGHTGPLLLVMSFFRRRTFSLSRRPRDRTPRNEAESASPKPEQESVDFGATNLRLADADSQLYIVINFPAWEGCVVKYPDPGTAAKLMKNLQMVSTYGL